MIRTVLAGLLALLTAALVACGGQQATEPAPAAPAPPVADTFVGALPGTEAYLAVLTDGTKVAGYLCDGTEASRWLGAAPLTAGQATLSTRDGTAIGEIRIDSRTATGTVTIGGVAREFTLAPATGTAGLYRATVRDGQQRVAEAGWVLLADGTQRGRSNLGPAPQLDPTADTVQLGGTRARADRLTAGFIEKTIF